MFSIIHKTIMNVGMQRFHKSISKSIFFVFVKDINFFLQIFRNRYV